MNSALAIRWPCIARSTETLPHGERGIRPSLRLQFPRRRRMPPDEVGHVEPGNLPILHDPAAPHHHAVGSMRTAQHERREWIAAAGEPQLIELERREIGQHADGNLANIRAPGAGGGAFGRPAQRPWERRSDGPWSACSQTTSARPWRASRRDRPPPASAAQRHYLLGVRRGRMTSQARIALHPTFGASAPTWRVFGIRKAGECPVNICLMFNLLILLSALRSLLAMQ